MEWIDSGWSGLMCSSAGLRGRADRFKLTRQLDALQRVLHPNHLLQHAHQLIRLQAGGGEAGFRGKRGGGGRSDFTVRLEATGPIGLRILYLMHDNAYSSSYSCWVLYALLGVSAD